MEKQENWATVDNRSKYRPQDYVDVNMNRVEKWRAIEKRKEEKELAKKIGLPSDD